MEQGKTNTTCAGIDISKKRLDAAIHGSADEAQFANTPEGFAGLAAWLGQHRVMRVGMEATGGYEAAVRVFLSEIGFAVVVHQPLEVRLFARLKRKRAKNDRIDARLIAAATAQVEAVKAAADPRIRELAERMTAYEQAADLLAQARTHREHTTLPDLRAGLEEHIAAMLARKKALAADLIRRLRAHADLAFAFDLLMSIGGVGRITAAALLIRMPELGAMARGEPASLLGVAPFDHDSGKLKGQRCIAGGRARLRRLVYLAALAAKRCDPAMKAFADRLAAKGKKPKVILVAIMRKIIEAANIVLKRAAPWSKEAPMSA